MITVRRHTSILSWSISEVCADWGIKGSRNFYICPYIDKIHCTLSCFSRVTRMEQHPLTYEASKMRSPPWIRMNSSQGCKSSA
uniref:Uncharacterized protein n=1 Tax=Arundo donax TaxID=35708 RepID=A0A0A9DEL1_ARUDO